MIVINFVFGLGCIKHIYMYMEHLRIVSTSNWPILKLFTCTLLTSSPSLPPLPALNQQYPLSITNTSNEYTS